MVDSGILVMLYITLSDVMCERMMLNLSAIVMLTASDLSILRTHHPGICDHKDATMVGFREKSGKSDQMPYFSQILVGFLGHQRNLEEFSSNSEIYLHDNV